MKTEIWNGYEIRFVLKDDKWWAVASDIAKAMGFKTAWVATQKMSNKYKGTSKVCTPSGEQEMIVLNEKGLYRLIMRSNKPEAEEFQDWVFEIIEQLRKSTGLEGFEVFRMLDKEHQKEAMKKLRDSLNKPARVDFIKANTIANKAISTKHGYQKMVKKGEMTPQMLVEREQVLEDTVELMSANDKYDLNVSVSKKIYEKHSKEKGDNKK